MRIPTTSPALLLSAALLLPRASSAWLLPQSPLKTVGTGAAIGGVGALAALWSKGGTEESLYNPAPASLASQNIVITGASTGLGLESAKRLAAGGANLILTARSDAKGQAAVDQVKEYLVNKGVSNQDQSLQYKLLDLDNLEAVKDAVASDWGDVTDITVLLNNAGIMALPERELTTDGVEKQMQSNHLGHFLLTSMLAPKMSDAARIINVSSTAHSMASSGLLFDYMWKADQDYSAWKSYGQSKLANIYFTQELQRRIDRAGLGWTAATLHPGVVGTDLGRYMMGEKEYAAMKEGKGGFLKTVAAKVMAAVLKTPQQGATTQIFLASGADGVDVRGKYFVDCKPKGLSDFATNVAAQERLWKESEELAGIEFNLPEGTPKA